MSATDDIPAEIPFTQMSLDRVSVQRKDARWLRDAVAAPDAVFVAASAGAVLVESGDGRLARTPVGELGAPAVDAAILLGAEAGTLVFAFDLDAPSAGSPAGELMGLRDVGARLTGPEAGLAAYAASMLNWHRRHRFCANCGAESVVEEAGYVRRCPRCRAHHFPRTDPVVIMSVEHDGRMLLGRRTGGPAGRMSVLAGFVSPGESAEEAVAREVQEESGIVARDPVFVASQPWPFPGSLMLGFHAVADGGEPVAHDGELDEVLWVDREVVRAAADGEDTWLTLPAPVSIARVLIDSWLAAGDPA